MTQAQSKALWRLSEAQDEATRKSALLGLASSLRHMPRSSLTAEQLDAVRQWEAEYRRQRREARGGTLREEHRSYYQDHKYSQTRKAYRDAHKEEHKQWLASWREANPERNELHRARYNAKRRGEEVDPLAGFALKRGRDADMQAAGDAIARLEDFLADGCKSRDECMEALHITNDDDFEELLEKATERLAKLWEDETGRLGL